MTLRSSRLLADGIEIAADIADTDAAWEAAHAFASEIRAHGAVAVLLALAGADAEIAGLAAMVRGLTGEPAPDASLLSHIADKLTRPLDVLGAPSLLRFISSGADSPLDLSAFLSAAERTALEVMADRCGQIAFRLDPR